MVIKIRVATHSDFEILDSFQDKLVEYERPLDPTVKKGKIEYYKLKNKLNSNNVRIFIAEEDENPIGCGIGEIQKSAKWLTMDNLGRIGMLFIEEAYRRKGVGKLIVKEIIKWFKSKKVTDYTLQVYSDNTNAIKAYENMGFKDYMVEMRRYD